MRYLIHFRRERDHALSDSFFVSFVFRFVFRLCFVVVSFFRVGFRFVCSFRLRIFVVSSLFRLVFVSLFVFWGFCCLGARAFLIYCCFWSRPLIKL